MHHCILNSIEAALHSLDLEGRITFANTAAARILGWSADELIGESQHRLVHHSRPDGTSYPASECPILQALKAGVPHRQSNEVFWRKDGTPFAVDFSLTPLQQDGVTIGGLISFRDVTEERRNFDRQLAEERAARAEGERLSSELGRINRELDQFAYVASHDLKAPLRGIASLAAWIDEDMGPVLDESSKKNLRLLRGRVVRMEALIDGLLEYSRAGRVRSRIDTVDVAALLDEVLEMLAPPPQASMVVGPGMPTLETEVVVLQQVFLNLLGNAIKHAGRSDVRVDVQVRDAGEFYEFSVKDNGPGIPRAFHSKVWEMFQTLQPRDTVEGAGMGLALVQKNVEARGGRVTLDSEPGQGATFSFLWPKRLEQDR